MRLLFLFDFVLKLCLHLILAAKQEAFEEANRLKNQFRALDDDEIGFLDELRGREREEEARVRKETAEGLDAFRKHRDEMEKRKREEEAQHDVVEEVKEDEWKVGRKRKAGKEKVGGLGIKLRKTSTVAAVDTGDKTDNGAQKVDKAAPTSSASDEGRKTTTKEASPSKNDGDGKAENTNPRNDGLKDEGVCAGNLKDDEASKSTQASSGGLGLVNYGSDEDGEW